MSASSGGPDTSVHMIIVTGKVAAVGGLLLFALPSVLPRLHGRARRAAIAFTAWAAVLAALLFAASSLRDPLGTLVNSHVGRYMPTGPGRVHAGPVPDHEAFLAAWASGSILIREAALCLLLAGGWTLIGLLAGHPAWTIPPLAAAHLLITLIAAAMTGLCLFDYDVFYAGTVFGPLVIDCLAPLSVLRETVIGLSLFTALLWTTFALDRRLSRTQEPVDPPRLAIAGAEPPSIGL